MLSFNRDNCTISPKATSVSALTVTVYDLLLKWAKAVSVLLSSAAMTKLAIVAFLVSIAFAVGFGWEKFRCAYDEIRQPGAGLFWLDMARIMLFLNLGIFLWRIILVIFYRPCRSFENQDLPSCTVIVPAYNEGRQVLDTLISVANSDYPVSKLQIIAVDDGSVDDTWTWIQTAAQRFAGRIEIIKLEKNSGKRRALYAGFLKSTGDILVTIDSDSIIETHTLRRLISPFVNDAQVGAVAGNVRVLNTEQGIIPKLLDVSFAYSFDFTRASQSMVDTVFCTPGALSAYKRRPVMKNLDLWLNQKFLGRPATIGEDRAMTNLIIRDGYKVKFQSNAVVYTNVPTRYTKLCKMFLRWARSNIRETILMAKFIFTRFRQESSAGARVNFLTAVINMFIPRAIIGALLVGLSLEMHIYLLQILAGASLWACAPAIFYAIRKQSTDALYAFGYALFFLVGLWWIMPYAMLTPANGNWLTRNLPADKPMPSREKLSQVATAAA